MNVCRACWKKLPLALNGKLTTEHWNISCVGLSVCLSVRQSIRLFVCPYNFSLAMLEFWPPKAPIFQPLVSSFVFCVSFFETLEKELFFESLFLSAMHDTHLDRIQLKNFDQTAGFARLTYNFSTFLLVGAHFSLLMTLKPVDVESLSLQQGFYF